MKEVTVEAELDLAAATAAEKGAMVVTEEVMGVAMAAELVEAKNLHRRPRLRSIQEKFHF